MSVTSLLRTQLPVLALAAVCLTACGSDSSDGSGTAGDEPSASVSSESGASLPPGTPDCATLWQDGATIPRSYAGCADDAGQLVKKDGLGCSSGQTIVRYDDRFYGVLGGTVHEVTAPLDKDRTYLASVRRCRA